MPLQFFDDVVRHFSGEEEEEEELDKEVKAVSTMGLIVPLQGMLGGRYGLALGCIIPLVSFYFIQLRPRKPNLPQPKPAQVQPSKQREPVDVQAPISERALPVISAKESPYGMGLLEITENGYESVINPTGCIDLGNSENKLSLDLLQEWLSKWGDNLLDLSENGGYVDFSGLKSFKIVLARFMGMVMGGGAKFEPSQMVLTAGATPTIEILAFSLAQPGEAFLIPSPYYSGFDRDIGWRSQVQLIPIPCGSDTGFKLTPGVLESTFQKMSRRGTRIRGILISNPSNPVGSILDRAALTSPYPSPRTRRFISSSMKSTQPALTRNALSQALLKYWTLKNTIAVMFISSMGSLRTWALQDLGWAFSILGPSKFWRLPAGWRDIVQSQLQHSSCALLCSLMNSS